MAAPTTMTTLPAKRKRNQVSYVDDNEELDTIIYGDNEALKHDLDADASEAEENDVAFTPGKKAAKAKPKPKKARMMPKGPKPKPVQPFRLLDLPQELRDQIYEYALTDGDDPVMIEAKLYRNRHTASRGMIYERYGGYRGRRWRRYSEGQKEKKAKQNPFMPALLRVSKQIHEETIGILYSQPFIVNDTMSLHAFLACIGRYNRERLEDITINTWGEGRGVHKSMNFTSMTMMQDCINLKALIFDCDISHYSNEPKRLASMLYRNGHYFFEAYGTANGAKDAVVDIIELSDASFSSNPKYRYGRPTEPADPIEKQQTDCQNFLREMLNH